MAAAESMFIRIHGPPCTPGPASHYNIRPLITGIIFLTRWGIVIAATSGKQVTSDLKYSRPWGSAAKVVYVIESPKRVVGGDRQAFKLNPTDPGNLFLSPHGRSYYMTDD